MARSSQQETAKIYAFPLTQDAARRRLAFQARKVAEIAESGIPRADFDGAWYHDEAIEAETRPSSH